MFDDNYLPTKGDNFSGKRVYSDDAYVMLGAILTTNILQTGSHLAASVEVFNEEDVLVVRLPPSCWGYLGTWYRRRDGERGVAPGSRFSQKFTITELIESEIHVLHFSQIHIGNITPIDYHYAFYPRLMQTFQLLHMLSTMYWMCSLRSERFRFDRQTWHFSFSNAPSLLY